MNQRFLEITYPTLQSLLWMQLEQAICPQSDVWPGGKTSGSLNAIPTRSAGTSKNPTRLVERVRNTTQLIYRSAIALQSATFTQTSSLELAEKIVTSVTPICQTWIPDRNWLTKAQPPLPLATVSVRPPGWIQFQVNPPIGALWLQFLVETTLGRSTSSPKPPRKPEEPSPSPFLWQYTHARCCSLLQLLDRQGLIQLQSSEVDSTWQIILPQPLPWLGDRAPFWQQPSPRSQLFFCIVDTLDRLYDPLQPPTYRVCQTLATELCQAFQTYYRADPPLNQESMAENQIQSGLVMVVKRLLYHLLTWGLQLPAPTAV